MKSSLSSRPLLSALTAALLLAIPASGVARAESTQRPPTDKAPLTALDKYVHAPDASYAWKVAGSVRGEAFYLDLTSQTWLTTNEVNRTAWRHWLVLAKPDDLQHSTALLFISGGSNRDERPPRPNEDLIRIARETKSVVVELKMVPNQPLVFGNDGKQRVEDDLIAYTWDKYLRTGDEKWPARLPMTKSAVRAMDAITEFCASEKGGKSKVDTFVVAGGSKRGWTTWTTAIVDRRVVAICPIVIDVLNMEPSMFHHFQAYGLYAPAVGDYLYHGIMDWMGTPQMTALRKIEDPYFYRDRLTLPKLILNACGDQFFLPDSSQFYFSELPGTKYLRYVPNADHSLRGSDAYATLLAWHHATIQKTALPQFTWKHGKGGELDVLPGTKPTAVKLWQATNPAVRDFRLEAIGGAWKETALTPDASGHYAARVEEPATGWRAYMVELTFDVGAPAPLKLTTDVRVIPDYLPHALPTPNPAWKR